MKFPQILTGLFIQISSEFMRSNKIFESLKYLNESTFPSRNALRMETFRAKRKKKWETRKSCLIQSVKSNYGRDMLLVLSASFFLWVYVCTSAKPKEKNERKKICRSKINHYIHITWFWFSWNGLRICTSSIRWMSLYRIKFVECWHKKAPTKQKCHMNAMWCVRKAAELAFSLFLCIWFD